MDAQGLPDPLLRLPPEIWCRPVPVVLANPTAYGLPPYPPLMEPGVVEAVDDGDDDNDDADNAD